MFIDFVTNKACKFFLFLIYYLVIAFVVGIIFQTFNPMLYDLISIVFKADVIKNFIEKDLLVNIFSLAFFHYVFVSLLLCINNKYHFHDKFRIWLKEKINIESISFNEYLDKIFILSLVWIYASKIIFDRIDNLFQAMTIYFILFTLFNSGTKKNY